MSDFRAKYAKTYVQDQELLTDGLRSSLDLSFTILHIAQVAPSAERRQLALGAAAHRVEVIRSLASQVRNSAMLADISNRADDLESRLGRLLNDGSS